MKVRKECQSETDKLIEVRKEYTELIRQMRDALRIDRIDTEDWPADSRIAIDALRARLENP